MQSSPSAVSTLPAVTSAIADDEEAERIRRLIARMTEAKRMLDGLLASLVLVETTMTASAPDGPAH